MFSTLIWILTLSNSFRQFCRAKYLDIFGAFSEPTKVTHFLNGHYVFASDEVKQDVQRELFRHFLHALSRTATLSSPTEALRLISQKSKAIVSLTFDDGFEDCYTIIAPVLEEFNLRAIFFVNPVSIGVSENQAQKLLLSSYNSRVKKKFLNSSQIIDLAQRGHLIGSHTTSHLRLNISDVETLHREIVDSKNFIERLTGQECDHFAYPFGGQHDVSNEAIEMALKTYRYVYSGFPSRKILVFENRVINRRHFEGDWPLTHVNYFLSKRS